MIPDEASDPAVTRPMFYRVDFFEAGELVAIRFFEPGERKEAERCAVAAVEKGTADQAELRGDGTRLLMPPFRRTRGPGAS